MKIMRAKRSASLDLNGRPRSVTGGALMPDNHPFVVACPDLFETVEEYVTREYPDYSGKVEQATAAPGEKRQVGRPLKRATKKEDEDR